MHTHTHTLARATQKAGFNLLLFGFGSKRHILGEFSASRWLGQLGSLLVVNGNKDDLTLASILVTIYTQVRKFALRCSDWSLFSSPISDWCPLFPHQSRD
jgi:hypothetical protein